MNTTPAFPEEVPVDEDAAWPDWLRETAHETFRQRRDRNERQRQYDRSGERFDVV